VLIFLKVGQCFKPNGQKIQIILTLHDKVCLFNRKLDVPKKTNLTQFIKRDNFIM